MEKIRRGLVSLFYLFLILTFFSAAASATTVVKIMPQSETVNQGDTVSVDIQITPDGALRGVQLELTYNTNLLTDVISDGGMFDNFELYPAQNQILGYQKSSQAAVSGQGNLAQIQFTASSTNMGTTSIDLSNVKVKDENGDPVSDIEVLDGTITVVEEPTSGNGASTTVKVMPQSKSVCQDQAFTVDIQVAPDRPLRGVQLELTFDTNLLTDAISDGGMFDNFELYPSQNQILGYQKSSQAAVFGQGNLAQVQLTASSTNMGTTSIDLSNVKVKDENGDSVPASDVTVTDGSVTVTECSGPLEPPTPQPRITAPEDGATINGTVEVTEVDDSGSDNITYNLFEYCADAGGSCAGTWAEIGNDTDGAPWDATWNTKFVMNGDYLIRATMGDSTNGLVGTDTIGVTVENEIPDNSIPLYNMWNYISFPGTLDNATPEHVLEGLPVLSDPDGVIIHYNAATGIWENVGEFKPRTAYAIRVSEPQTIVNLDYMPGVPASMQMYEGWNSVGLIGNAPGTEMNNAEAAFDQIDDSYDRLVGPWVSASGGYYSQNGFNENVYGPTPADTINKDSTTYMLNRYEGHWIHMTSADLLS